MKSELLNNDSPLILNEPPNNDGDKDKKSRQNKRAARKFAAYNNSRTYFAFPYAAISLIFVIVPLFFILAYAFRNDAGGFSFDAFKKFSEGYVWKTIGNSFLMATLTTIICFVLCYPLALAVNRLKPSFATVVIMMFVLPMWINSLLRLYAIKWLLEVYVEKGFWLILFGMVYDFIPFMLLPIYTVIANTDKSVIEAAEDLGASPIVTLLKVRLPLSVPGIVSGVMMVFMPTISSFAASKVLGGSKFVMFGNFIDARFSEAMDYATGSAYSIMLMVLILVSIVVANKLSKGKASLSMGGGIV